MKALLRARQKHAAAVAAEETLYQVYLEAGETKERSPIPPLPTFKVRLTEDEMESMYHFLNGNLENHRKHYEGVLAEYEARQAEKSQKELDYYVQKYEQEYGKLPRFRPAHSPSTAATPSSSAAGVSTASSPKAASTTASSTAGTVGGGPPIVTIPGTSGEAPFQLGLPPSPKASARRAPNSALPIHRQASLTAPLPSLTSSASAPLLPPTLTPLNEQPIAGSITAFTVSSTSPKSSVGGSPHETPKTAYRGLSSPPSVDPNDGVTSIFISMTAQPETERPTTTKRSTSRPGTVTNSSLQSILSPSASVVGTPQSMSRPSTSGSVGSAGTPSIGSTLYSPSSVGTPSFGMRHATPAAVAPSSSAAVGVGQRSGLLNRRRAESIDEK